MTVDDQTPRVKQRDVLLDSARKLDLDYLGTLNPDASEAASQQIADQIRTAITAGHLGAGEMLPSQSRLAAHYGVARETTKTALTQLRNEGLVRSWQGKGTFVRSARPAGEQDLRVELGDIHERVHRLKRELVAVDRALTGLLGRLPEDGQCPCSALDLRACRGRGDGTAV